MRRNPDELARHYQGAKRRRQAAMNGSERAPSFLWLFLGHVVLLAVTIVVVWMVYAYLHAYQLVWLGWFYAKLLPLTNGLYLFVETYFPSDVKYKIRGAITDDL